MQRRVVVEWHRRRPPARRAALAHQGVAQRPDEVAALVFPVDQARPGEHARAGLLHEVLGLFARGGPGPGGAVEARQLLGHTVGVEPAGHAHPARPCPCVRRHLALRSTTSVLRFPPVVDR